MSHQTRKRRRLALPRPSVIALAIYTAVVLGGTAHAAPLDVSQVPPALGQTLAPNILYIHDDSGSMERAYMPDDTDTISFSSTSNSNVPRYSSSTFNRMYFNPSITYHPPLDHDGVSLGNASFTAAWNYGYNRTSRDSSTTNLDTLFRVPTAASPTSSSFKGATTAWPSQRAFYHEYSPTESGCTSPAITNNSCYVKRVISAAQEQDFANWYAYYRTREMASKAGISRAFAQLGEGARLGYGRINDDTATSIDGKSVKAVVRGVRPFVDDPADSSKQYRKAFFDWLFALNSDGMTPLRRALDAAGRYYENADPNGPWSTTPGTSGGNLLACRKSFTILMTDGYWNDDAAETSDARNNNDGGEGNPFADTYSNTLADVAMYYWKRDLISDDVLEDKVPPTTRNPATWQHMATYTIGLGVEGQVSKADAFGAITSGTPSIAWPQPGSNSVNNIDDLLHAAVNGRGDYFSAGNPEEFAAAMQATLASIADQVGAIAPLGQSSSAATADTFLFQAKFDTTDWSGWLTATAFNPATGTLEATSVWTSNLPASRNILTYNTEAAAGRTFTWANLSAAQQTQLGTQGVLDWVRGDQSQEQPSGAFRKRSATGRIGDIVNSKPLYVAARNEGYGLKAGIPEAQRTAYLNRINSTTFKQRRRLVYVGANDGMLHAFNAGAYADDGDTFAYEPVDDFSNGGDGVERFAYVPAAVYPNLPTLAHPDYTHHYFVDGNPTAGDAYLGSGGSAAWKTVLVGSTGAGGRAYFALDIETPDAMAAEKVLWEFTHDELGLAVGQATIARLNNGQWAAIFGNGYNSTSQRAQLFIVNLNDGTLIKKIDTGVGASDAPNGLAAPQVVDINLDGNADLVYAGDYQGNLWKFDLTDTDEDDPAWSVAFEGKPLFKATDADGNSQPITARPTVRRHPAGGLVVYFGTGKLLLVGDQGNHDVQALYGIFDLCGKSNTGDCLTTASAQRVLKSALVEQDIFEESTHDFGGNTTSSQDYRLVTQNALGTSKGFYITLLPPSGSAEGERIVGPADISFSDRVIFTTVIPNDDPCAEGADGWLMEVDPFSGGRTDYSVFDMNADGHFDTTDRKTVTVVSGRKTPGGATPAVLHGGDRSYKIGIQAGANQTIANRPDPNLVNRQSWQQIR